MLGVGISSIVRYFLNVGIIPLGGFKFGSPSVNKTIKVFLFYAYFKIGFIKSILCFP